MIKGKVLALFLALFVLDIQAAVEKKPKIVSTLLNAKWTRPPFLLETAEFLASENNDYFWAFLDYFAEPDNLDLQDKLSHEELYKKMLEFTSRYLSPAQLKLLKFELALHTLSPKIEMFNQVAFERGVDQMNCQAVLDLNGELKCDFSEAENGGGGNAVQLIEHDHKYVHWPEESKQVVVLYGNIGSKATADLHQKLKIKASQGLIQYVFRPFVKNNSGPKLRMSGYGVELQIKSRDVCHCF